MLTYDKIGRSAGQVNYYVSLGRGEHHQHDYYSEDDKSVGQWWGRGAGELGLDGVVDEEAFRNILLGKSPGGERVLVAAPKDPGKERRSGWDLTFSVPKSVSVAYSQANAAGRNEIIAGCETALHRILELFDELCGNTRRGYNGAVQEKAGLVAALFRHETARPVSGDAPGEIQKPDPNLHWHVVLCNVTAREDGTFGAFDGQELYRRGMKLALGTLFRVELSKQMRALGLESYRPEKPNGRGEKERHFELSCVPRKLLREMSKRRKAVEKWLNKRGLRGWKASQKGTLATREKKKAFTRQELDKEWKSLGARHGFTNRELVNAKRIFQDVDTYQVSRKCLEDGISRLGKEKSRFTFLEMLRYTAEEAQAAGVSLRDVKAVVDDALLYSKELVKLRDVQGERQWTTRENLEIEKRLLGRAHRLKQTGNHSTTYSDVASVLDRYPTMRDEQKAAIWHMCIGGDLACVNGVSGSGKTYALRAAADVWRAQGFQVLGTALGSKMAQTLEEESGILSLYCHQLLAAVKRKEVSIDEKTVLVVEEAGMIDTRTMDKLLGLVAVGGGKVVLTGAYDQLQPIDAGAPFRVISEREGVVQLEEITRQESPEDRELVRDLRAGSSAKVLHSIIERELLFVGKHPDESHERLVRDWKRRAIDEGELDQCLILAGTNATCRELNSLCQKARLEAGELGHEKVQTEDDDFHVGDVVMARKNDHPLMIKNGMTGTVTAIVDCHTVRVRFRKGFQVDIDLNEYGNLVLGYAASVHKYQGQTADYAFLVMDQQMTDREQAYVGGSRHRKEARFYSDVLSGGETIEQLGWLMERSRLKDMAVEFIQEQTQEMD